MTGDDLDLPDVWDSCVFLLNLALISRGVLFFSEWRQNNRTADVCSWPPHMGNFQDIQSQLYYLSTCPKCGRDRVWRSQKSVCSWRSRCIFASHSTQKSVKTWFGYCAKGKLKAWIWDRFRHFSEKWLHVSSVWMSDSNRCINITRFRAKLLNIRMLEASNVEVLSRMRTPVWGKRNSCWTCWSELISHDPQDFVSNCLSM